MIDLPTIQRYLNFHFSVTMDLFGSDVSSNAATFYSTGLKGRFDETKIDDDHVLSGATYPVLEIRDDRLATAQAPALNALNEKLRDDFIRDAAAGIERWNKIIEKHGIPFRLKAPHKAFHRRIGPLAAAQIDPDGNGRLSGRMGGERRPVAAEHRRPGIRRVADGPSGRTRKVRELDRAAFARRRQPARGLRVRQVRLGARGGGANARDDGRGHPPAPHRSGDLHSLQHLRRDLPGRRRHA